MRSALLSIAAAFTLAALPATADVITVGPGGDFSTIAAAVAAANAGDEIQVAAGTYVNDFPVVDKALTIVGVGGMAVLDANGTIGNGKAIMIISADTTIRFLEFRDATVNDNNGAGIRHEGGDLTVENSIFRNNQDGILANDSATTDIVIRDSQFIDNGFGDGFTHALYANHVASLLVEDSSFTGTLIGHDIKSRAAITNVFDNFLDDGVTGSASFAIDLSNCGLVHIAGNTISQGPNTDNPSMVAYGPEGCTNLSNSLLVENNIFNNTLEARPAVGVNNFTTIVAMLCGNTFNNVDVPLAGPGVFLPGPCGDPTGGNGDGEVGVPEPATLALFAAGLGGLAWARRRRR